MTLESWNDLFVWASIVLLGLTFIVGTATLYTDRKLAKEQAIELARAKTDANQALVEANKSKVELEAQKERTAEAMRLVEQEKIERLKIEERLAYRRISPEQQVILMRSLARFTGERVGIVTTSTEPEIAYFCGQIKQVLQATGTTFEHRGPTISAQNLPGVTLTFGDAKAAFAKAIMEALTEAKIVTGGIRPEYSPSATGLRIIIGPKE